MTIAASISAYLPQQDGLLPKWLLLVSLIAGLNAVQAYASIHYTQRVYEGEEKPQPKVSSSSSSRTGGPTGSVPAPAVAYPSAARTTTTTSSPVTAFSARTFGTWTFTSCVVRFYAAYHLGNPVFYQLAFWTYIIAFAHFASEWLVYRTARWGAGLAGPVFISTGTLVWMLAQWDYYVK